MENRTLNTVEYIIDAFGGGSALALAVHRSPAAITYWKRRDMIPTRIRVVLLAAAAQRGIKLSSADLDFGKIEIPGVT